jgi:hypothetical protein
MQIIVAKDIVESLALLFNVTMKLSYLKGVGLEYGRQL